MSAAWARPGAKCVCIAPAELISAALLRNPWGSFLASGGVYTVRSFVEGTDGKVRITLEEIRNPTRPCVVGDVEWGFEVEYFRPLISRTQEQDLEHFLPLLNTVEEPA